MIWNGDGIIKMEEGEPAIRSCWECNEAHEHLKKVNTLHVCPWCDKYWVYDQFMDWETDEECDAFFAEKGLEPGDSTRKIDGGYRVTCMKLEFGRKSTETTDG